MILVVDDFSVQFFCIFESIVFCFVIAIFDILHNVVTIHLPELLTASGNLF